jgi:hypothetical protein
MVRHLADLAEDRLILSFAPWTPQYVVLKRIGELFPGPSKVGGWVVSWGCGGLCVEVGWDVGSIALQQASLWPQPVRLLSSSCMAWPQAVPSFLLTAVRPAAATWPHRTTRIRPSHPLLPIPRRLACSRPP